MAYVYRFKDIDENVIYIGYTGQQLAQRISQHFTKGHLDKKCYRSIAKIEYQKYKTKADAQIMEVVYINKYKPKYNRLNKQNDNITFTIEHEDKWNVYKVLKTKMATNANRKMSILARVAMIIYIISVLIYLIK